MNILVDTNVLLDVLLHREAHYALSSKVWNIVEQGRATGFVSAISFNNSFYLIRKPAGSERALESVKELRSVFRTVPVDESIIDSAIESGAKDFEDAIQAACADRVNADCIITRNAKHFSHYGGNAIESHEFLALMAGS